MVLNFFSVCCRYGMELTPHKNNLTMQLLFIAV